MPTSTSGKRPYLIINEELQMRIDLEYSRARRGKRNYSMSHFLQRLITEALDQRDDMSGAKAALTNPVEKRFVNKMDNLEVLVLANFYLTAIRTITPQGAELNVAALGKEALKWAARNHKLFDEQVAVLRNSPASSPAKFTDEAS